MFSSSSKSDIFRLTDSLRYNFGESSAIVQVLNEIRDDFKKISELMQKDSKEKDEK